ncbi:MAG TPA: hypothetical protein VN238_06570 [Solirubrobacteraceae bacterium]|nr:hypothetical protein [Solirubrobacteraceae bacterium]
MTGVAPSGEDDVVATFTRTELDQLARLPTARMQPLLAEGLAAEALDLELEVEATWRAFCGMVEDWAHLIAAHAREMTGSAFGGGATRLEHVATLAARRKLDEQRLGDITTMLTGAEHPLRAQLGGDLVAGGLDDAATTWRRIARCMADAVALRCDHLNHVLADLHERGGESALDDAMRRTAGGVAWRHPLPAQGTTNPATLLRQTARLLADGPGVALHITEERDRYVLEHRSCHCGRQVHEAFAYGWPLPTVESPVPSGLGCREMTPYQVHFTVVHGRWATDGTGPVASDFDCRGLDVVDGPCRLYVNKAARPATERVVADLVHRPTPNPERERALRHS